MASVLSTAKAMAKQMLTDLTFQLDEKGPEPSLPHDNKYKGLFSLLLSMET